MLIELAEKLTGNFAKVAPLPLQATIRLTSLTYLARAATPGKEKERWSRQYVDVCGGQGG